MIDFRPISQKEFVKLAGQIGVEVIGRNEAGVSYLLPDGRLVAEIHNGTEWEYVEVREEESGAEAR
jgi:hypothetical protein